MPTPLWVFKHVQHFFLFFFHRIQGEPCFSVISFWTPVSDMELFKDECLFVWISINVKMKFFLRASFIYPQSAADVIVLIFAHREASRLTLFWLEPRWRFLLTHSVLIAFLKEQSSLIINKMTCARQRLMSRGRPCLVVRHENNRG